MLVEAQANRALTKGGRSPNRQATSLAYTARSLHPSVSRWFMSILSEHSNRTLTRDVKPIPENSRVRMATTEGRRMPARQQRTHTTLGHDTPAS